VRRIANQAISVFVDNEVEHRFNHEPADNYGTVIQILEHFDEAISALDRQADRSKDVDHARAGGRPRPTGASMTKPKLSDNRLGQQQENRLGIYQGILDLYCPNAVR
jgi:hypothetical protein